MRINKCYLNIQQAAKKKIKGIPTTKVPNTKVPDTNIPTTKVPNTKVPNTKVPNTKRSRFVGQMWRFFFKYNTEPKAALGIAAASFLLPHSFSGQEKDIADSPTRLWRGTPKKQSIRKQMSIRPLYTLPRSQLY